MREHSCSGYNVSKRVCKACDRCRLKKSKCDGASPCSRCRADNAICVFGARKKAHDKVYPKRYVELLLHQQDCLVHGLQELYQRAITGGGGLDSLKAGTNEHSFTHDLLSRLGALDYTKGERFEENPEIMQQNLWAPAAGLQRELSSDASFQGPDSAGVGDHRFVNAISQHVTPPTFPASGPALMSESSIELEEKVACNLPVTPLMSVQSSIDNPHLFRSCPLQYNESLSHPFDDINYMTTAGCATFGFEDVLPCFNCQLQLNSTNSTSNLHSTEVCEDLGQSINPVFTDLTSSDEWM